MRCRNLYDYKLPNGETQRNVVWFGVGKVKKEAYANIVFANGYRIDNMSINKQSDTVYLFSAPTGATAVMDCDALTVSITDGGTSYACTIGNATTSGLVFNEIIDYSNQWIPFTYNGSDSGRIEIKDEVVSIDSYADEQEGVRASLTQRLSVLKGELWYECYYGLPLTDKVVNKAIIDANIIDIIMSHPNVKTITSYNSSMSGRHYRFDFSVLTTFSNESADISLTY